MIPSQKFLVRSALALFCATALLMTSQNSFAVSTGGGTQDGEKAPGATSQSTFFSSGTPEVTPAHSNADLNAIFTTGVAPFNTGMIGKIYPYPMTHGGVAGAPLLNGCYDAKNRRLGDFDAGTNSCASYAAARPDQSIFRLFTGYSVTCDEAPQAGKCNNISMSMNCTYEQIQIGAGSQAAYVSTRDCAAGTGIIRHAKALSPAVSTKIGCFPGEDGSVSTPPLCPKCPSGTYSGLTDNVAVGCASCKASLPFVPGVSTGKYIEFVNSQPTSWTTNPATGATSANDCIPTSLDCIAGYTSLDGLTCVPDPGTSTCDITFDNITSKSPSTAGGADGEVTISYKTKNSATNAPNIISPNPVSGTANPNTFAGLKAGVYTIEATDDKACKTSTTVTLVDPAPASTICPTGYLAVYVGDPKFPTGPYDACSTGGGCACIPNSGSVCPYPMSISVSNMTNATSTVEKDGAVSLVLNGNVGTLQITHWNAPPAGSWSISGSTGSYLYGAGLAAGTYTVGAIDPSNTACKANVVFAIGVSAPPPSGVCPGVTNTLAVYPGEPNYPSNPLTYPQCATATQTTSDGCVCIAPPPPTGATCAAKREYLGGVTTKGIELPKSVDKTSCYIKSYKDGRLLSEQCESPRSSIPRKDYQATCSDGVWRFQNNSGTQTYSCTCLTKTETGCYHDNFATGLNESEESFERWVLQLILDSVIRNANAISATYSDPTLTVDCTDGFHWDNGQSSTPGPFDGKALDGSFCTVGAGYPAGTTDGIVTPSCDQCLNGYNQEFGGAFCTGGNKFDGSRYSAVHVYKCGPPSTFPGKYANCDGARPTFCEQCQMQ
jgi:hypothetical protein